MSEILDRPLVFDEDQERAISACCDVDKRIVAVTGKAGTGKTLLIKEIHRRLSLAGYTVGCSAPTGKAAKRIIESTGIPAQTNHRMLGYGMPTEYEETNEKTGRTKIVKLSTGPRYTRREPMQFDTILCDEYAMVNQEINRNLIDALKAGARICMFGDVNQLRPIEENKRLAEEPSAFQRALGKFDGIELRTIHRQEEGSGIADNGSMILLGRMPKKHQDFRLQITSEPVRDIQAFVESELARGVDFSSTDAQIITCMNKSWIGTKKLNLVIQNLFWRRERPSLTLARHKWEGEDATAIRVQVGTKVVCTSNIYDLGNEQSMFNGELGTIVEINHEDESFDVDFGDRIVTVPPLMIIVRDNGNVMEADPRKSIDLAYVLTTHKTQGSEYKHVCYIMNKSTIYTQSRRNFYTGITRAREFCTVITDMVSLTKSVKFQG